MGNTSEESSPNKTAAQPDWNRMASSPEFRRLLAARRKFVIPAVAFFVAYYLLLHILMGFAPRVMSLKIFGAVTLGYLFALSQFVVGGGIAILYLRASAKLDVLIETLLKNQRDLPERSE
jgi:uncharacterized membrane protein (DUF485 family)